MEEFWPLGVEKKKDSINDLRFMRHNFQLMVVPLGSKQL